MYIKGVHNDMQNPIEFARGAQRDEESAGIAWMAAPAPLTRRVHHKSGLGRVDHWSCCKIVRSGIPHDMPPLLDVGMATK